MSQEQIQELSQVQKLSQSITQQQLLQAQLIELPITQLVERVNAEMDDNPALELNTGDEPDDNDFNDNLDNNDDNDTTDDYEREERQSALDAALESIGRDDEELPVYHPGQSYQEEREEIVYGASQSFYDLLNEQMGMIDLTDRQRNIMEYLIGSLDEDGLLRKSLESISDELAIYQNIDASADDILHVLHILQTFDPAGIGARDLQECLLLQIQRREPSRLRDLMIRVVKDFFEAFTKKHWQRIQQALQLNDLQAKTLIDELRKLNPKPGASLGETVGRSLQQITPDFIIDTHDDGSVTFQLNYADVPELHVSQSFTDTLREYQDNREHMSRQMKEALLYTKKKIDAAQQFIEAIKVRNHTLIVTMQAIILDLSTVSRVSNSKYAQTRWGTFPLRHFFTDGYVTAEGDELSTRVIKAALRDLIAAEDKQHPYSDETLCQLLASQGYPIARRTVAKYREQLGIPVARLRK